MGVRETGMEGVRSEMSDEGVWKPVCNMCGRTLDVLFRQTDDPYTGERITVTVLRCKEHGELEI